MSSKTVLVVEDDEDIAQLVRLHLEKEGFNVLLCSDGLKGQHLAKVKLPDLLILDWMLPGLPGIEICRNLKQDSNTRGIPILMLTARNDDTDIITGMELGAEDYVTKPFSPKVLMARVRALIRRQSQSFVESDAEDILKFPGLSIHEGKHEVLREGQKLDLTFLEFKVLHLMAKRPGWVFSRQQIVEGVRGGEYPVTERSVDVVIAGLRKKLSSHQEWVETIRGAGYRFREIS